MLASDINPKGLEAHGALFLFGVLLHIFAFRVGEWDLVATKFVLTFAALQAGLTYGLTYVLNDVSHPAFLAFRTAATLTICLISGIFSSILVYRGAFHRLNRFPGPFMARLSNFYVTGLSVKNMQLYNEVQKLHEQYGDVVRIGPSELSINDSKALHAIHSNSSPCTKGPWYNILHPMVSLQLIRNRQEHTVRRKAWDRAFGSKALRDYEPRVSTYTDKLLSNIENQEGRPMDVSDWFNFYSFDVMGDLAFGKTFGMLDGGVKHYFMETLHADMTNVGVFSHLLWLFPIFKATPILNAENKKFWKWVTGQIHTRMENKPDRPDVFSWILDAYETKKNSTWQDRLDLYGDGYLICVAGSDTTAASLTCAFFLLAQNPEVLKKLQAEVDSFYEQEDAVEATGLSHLKYLQAVIDETLRLHPPVPSGVQRMTPPEGLQIGDHFIPGDTIVQIPSHTMYRDERLFKQANEFIPERWTTRSELTEDPSVFVPFSTGRYSCVGKQLGLMEIRLVTARIVRRWNVSLAPGQSPEAFEQGKKDTFTLTLPQLKLVFTPRKPRAGG